MARQRLRYVIFLWGIKMRNILTLFIFLALISEANAAPMDAGGGNSLPDIEINLGALDDLQATQPIKSSVKVIMPPKQPIILPITPITPIQTAQEAPKPIKSEEPIAQPLPQSTETTPEITPEFAPKGFVEAGGNFSSLTKNYPNWSGEYLKGEAQTDKDNRWSMETLNQREFSATGDYGAIGTTHNFIADWYSTVNVGGSTEGFFLPRYRVDAFLNRKWLDDRQLITTIGLGDYKARDVHEDRSVFLGATYYFKEPWIVQSGVRFNNSNPASVDSFSGFVAVTQGRDKDQFITLRYGYGKEAYQVIGVNESLSDFNSQIISLEIRKWFGEKWGINARGEEYLSPNYNRIGGSLGIFREF